MQHPNLKALTILGCLLATPALWAQKTTTEELQEINQRRAILEAQLKEAEAEKRLLELRTQIGGLNPNNKKAPPPIETDPGFGVPTVSHVEGTKDNLEAVLIYRGNVRQRVTTGDVVYGSVVRKIALNEVVMVDIKNNTMTRLQFSSGPLTRDAANQGPGAGMPPGSPIPTVPSTMGR
jgi:type IV pilus biogenesis protein PilP